MFFKIASERDKNKLISFSFVKKVHILNKSVLSKQIIGFLVFSESEIWHFYNSTYLVYNSVVFLI
jgi:hypothetical protein